MPDNINIVPTAGTDGVLYANAVPLTSTEASLRGGTGAETTDPIPVTYGQAILAVVQLSINGFITGNSTYVVLQTDLGDGVWIDVAWLFWNATTGSATFVLCGGGVGGINNAFQHTRNSGQVPQPQQSGSNSMPLGGRVRFVGKTVMTAGSSSAAGVSTAVTATIRYKLLGLG